MGRHAVDDRPQHFTKYRQCRAPIRLTSVVGLFKSLARRQVSLVSFTVTGWMY